MAQQENLGSDGDELKRLDIEKRRLECAKLRAEISEISLAWWQRPGYVGSVLTLAALLTGWVSGYFPSERETLKREIDNLRAEKSNRTQEALLLNSDLARLKDKRNEFKQQVSLRLSTSQMSSKRSFNTWVSGKSPRPPLEEILR